MIDRLVQEAVAQRMAKLVPSNIAPLAPAFAPPEILVIRTSRPGPMVRLQALPIACPDYCRNFCGPQVTNASTR
jgi:hypothetical protein